jgi:hypothetical protein
MRFLWSILLIGLLLVSVVSAQEATPTPPCYDPDLGWWRQENENCAIQFELSVKLDIDIAYPYDLTHQAPFTAMIMQSYLDEAYFSAFERAEGGLSWDLLHGYADRPTLYMLKIDYQQFSYSPNITTVVFKQIVAGGPGHGAVPRFRSFTFDLENQTVLRLEDIFREDVNPYRLLGYSVYQQLQAQVPPQYFELLGRAMFEEAEQYQAWALTQNSLDFFYSGALTGEYGEDILYRVSIPLEDLKDSLSPEFATQRLFG